MAKASSSHSPLSRPQTLIHRYAADLQQYLYLPDPSSMYVTLATLVANMMEGDPVWVILTGSSGCGKSTCIMAIQKCPRVMVCDVIEGKAGLISGSSKKDRVKGATGGLLFEIGRRGMLAIKEFTATMNQEQSKLKDALSFLRMIGDGELDRNVGSDGGRRIQWKGNIGLIGGSTSAIDLHYRVVGELGQRWIMYRFAENDGYQMAVKGLTERDRAESMGKIQQLTTELIDSLSLEWCCHYECLDKMADEEHKCIDGPGRRELSSKEINRLTSLGTFSATARSIVPRDDRSGDIVGRRDIESPTRMVKALGKLYVALEVLGLSEKERWPLIHRVAWDSITPRSRGMLLGVLRPVEGLDSGEAAVRLTMRECEDVMGISANPARRVVGDLVALGLVSQVRGGGEVWMADGVREEIKKWR